MTRITLNQPFYFHGAIYISYIIYFYFIFYYIFFYIILYIIYYLYILVLNLEYV